MSENQLNLIDNFTSFIIDKVIDENDRIYIDKTLHIEHCYNLNNLKNKIFNIIQSNDLERHFVTQVINRIEYWIEFLLEIVYIKIKSIDTSIKERYFFWENYKLQYNINNLLK